MAAERPELPKPHLARIFEAVAAVMDLDEGQHRLELVFADGHLQTWFVHDERNGHEALRRFDARAEPLATALS